MGLCETAVIEIIWFLTNSITGVSCNHPVENISEKWTLFFLFNPPDLFFFLFTPPDLRYFAESFRFFLEFFRFSKVFRLPVFRAFQVKIYACRYFPIISDIVPDISDKFLSGPSAIYSPKWYLQHWFQHCLKVSQRVFKEGENEVRKRMHIQNAEHKATWFWNPKTGRSCPDLFNLVLCEIIDRTKNLGEMLQ